MMSSVWQVLPAEVARWASMRVRVQWDTKGVNTAAVSLDGARGYSLHVCSAFWARLSDVARCAVLWHEISHILRGDCLVAREFATQSEVRAWNLASDSHINRQIPGADQLDEELGAQSGGGIVTYERLREDYDKVGSWPTDIPATRVLWGWLLASGAGGQGAGNQSSGEQGESGAGGQGAGESGAGEQWAGALSDDVLPASGDSEACAREHARAVLSAPSSVRAAAGAGLGSGAVARRAVRPREEPRLVRVLRDILSGIPGSGGGVPSRRRTWAREHRASPLLRGSYVVRRHQVVVALDVSGSVAEHAQRIAGMGEALRDSLDVRLCAWATRASWVRRASDIGSVDVGIGTEPNSMLDLVGAACPDVLVIVTDGEFYDYVGEDKLPRCPIVWALVGSARTDYFARRPRDKVILVDGGGQ